MLSKEQMAGVAEGISNIPQETWAGLLRFLEDAANDANENTTAPGEEDRDWWAGHERGVRDVIGDLKALRDGSWREQAGYAGVEEEDDGLEAVKLQAPKAKSQRSSKQQEEEEE